MVLTKNTYRNTVMKESQVAVMEEFVDNVKILINALGYKVLDPLLLILCLVIAQAIPVQGKLKMVAHLRKLRTTLRSIKSFNFAIPFNYSKIHTPQGLHPTLQSGIGAAEICN